MITDFPGPKKLYLLQLSATTVSLAQGRTMEMIVGCYLVETSDGKHILIDSGMAPDAMLPGLSRGENEKNVIEHLAALGLRPDDIDTLICTHFDVDHAGYHDAFVGAELIVQREHSALALVDIRALPLHALTGIIQPCVTGSLMGIRSSF
jgi:N-acyl homoserine lactone hydrolase